MKKILITGFEPFGGEEINPSWEAVSRLPEQIGKYSLTKLLLPVVFGKAAEITLKKAAEIDPQVIISVGQAGGRSAVTPELVAINLRHASIPDNDGNQPKDEPVKIGGENAYFISIPARKISEAIASSGIPSHVSYSAGAYVCNDLIYTLLDSFKGSNIRCGFIHIPYCKEQGKEPTMEMDDIVRALEIAIENLD